MLLKAWAVMLSILLLSLHYQLWFGPESYQQLNELQRLIQKQQQENAELTARNKILAAEVQDLKHGLEAIEEKARREFGMIKRGEIFYQIVD
ncbi:MAG: cell division protein FtsB [Pseudomonadota bacterium]|nr:cell division protein FtsB [Pseudomonadota bacterium]